MATVRYVADQAGMRALARDAGLRDATQEAGQAIVEQAKSYAPRAPGAGKHFRFGRSLKVLGTDTDERGHVTHAGSNDRIGHLVEFGSVNNPPYAPLRKAVKALRLRFEPGPRQ